MKEEYSNREVDMIVDGLKDHFTVKLQDISNSLARVEAQTMKHNGRMSKMEAWRNYMLGAISIISAVVLPLMGYVLYRVANLHEEIRLGISEELNQYNVQIK